MKGLQKMIFKPCILKAAFAVVRRVYTYGTFFGIGKRGIYIGCKTVEVIRTAYVVNVTFKGIKRFFSSNVY
jgi:hypothetical protein